MFGFELVESRPQCATQSRASVLCCWAARLFSFRCFEGLRFGVDERGFGVLGPRVCHGVVARCLINNDEPSSLEARSPKAFEPQVVDLRALELFST